MTLDHTPDQLRKEIMDKVAEYYTVSFANRKKGFIHCSGKDFDAEELKSGVEAILDGWWTDGRFADRFIEEFRKVIPAKHVTLANSGSSANLLALFSLTSHLIPEGRRLRPGDEVITLAAGFPTTVNPIILAQCVPVFLDIEMDTLNIDTAQLEQALSPKTKAVFIAHTLGNPFPADKVREFCTAHDLWMIEDCCDALGATYLEKPVGTFGDLATFSFYPAHQITMGEGGAMVTDDDTLDKIAKSLRDWGRDCWCKTGRDNTCGMRFSHQQGSLPFGYDHKYIYSHLGFNLKLTDMQAAIGYAQIQKLPLFLQKRRQHFQQLAAFFSGHTNYFSFPKANGDPSWFGFTLTLRPGCPFTRNQAIDYLQANGIGTRLVFGGNLTKQPYFRSSSVAYRAFPLPNTDYIMDNSFWIGVQPNLTDEDMARIIAVFAEFLQKYQPKRNDL
ncbi:MAG TPA: lipopolysaccharide biosynthesis protein RfbH [Candidatus Nanoarchaeia archaeon]|nr:lipopolysaccharide biosynthesis protein RfbH [Candidatus Nanoarchaeia archaeon]